ncbi:MAG: ABC transporter substrate-binding protein [Thermodesulfobacteriota bacterium]
MEKRRFLSALVLIILGGMLHYQLASAQKVRIAPCVKSNPSYNLPFFAAEERDLWKKNGIEAEWIAIKGGSAMARAFASRALDMGICGPLGGIRAISRGVPMLIIADFQSPQDVYVWVLTGSPIKKPMDLKGTKIGQTRLGGTFHAYGIWVAKALGLEKDIKFVGAGGSVAMQAGLQSGIYDAIVSSFYSSAAPLKFSGRGRPVLRVQDYLPKEWMNLAVFSRRDFADKKPDQVRGALKGLFEAAAFVMKNADWSVQIFKKHFGYPEKGARQVHRDTLRYGRRPTITRKAVENARNFLIEAGLIPKKKAPPLDKLYTTRFVR